MNDKLLHTIIQNNIDEARTSREHRYAAIDTVCLGMLSDPDRHFDLFLRIDTENMSVMHNVRMVDIRDFLIKNFDGFADEESQRESRRRYGEALENRDTRHIDEDFWAMWSVVEISGEHERPVSTDFIKHIAYQWPWNTFALPTASKKQKTRVKWSAYVDPSDL